MGDCAGGCPVTERLEKAISGVVVAYKEWSDQHQKNSDRYMDEQNAKANAMFDRLGKCVDSTNEALTKLAVGAKVFETQAKDIQAAHEEIRRVEGETSLELQRIEDQSSESWEKHAKEHKDILREARIFYIGVIIFLLLTEHGRGLLEAVGKKIGVWG